MIKLIEGFFIKVDGDQYALIKHKEGKTKTGESTITTTVYGYFGTIEGCMKKCRDAVFAEAVTGKLVTLSEAIETLKDLNEELKKLIPEEVK